MIYLLLLDGLSGIAVLPLHSGFRRTQEPFCTEWVLCTASAGRRRGVLGKKDIRERAPHGAHVGWAEYSWTWFCLLGDVREIWLVLLLRHAMQCSANTFLLS